jgi:hypothetical protein
MRRRPKPIDTSMAPKLARLPKGSIVAATAGTLRAYARQPLATIEEETVAFEQGVTEEVAGSLGG